MNQWPSEGSIFSFFVLPLLPKIVNRWLNVGAVNIVERQRASVSSLLFFSSSSIYCLLLKFGLASKLLLPSVILVWQEQCLDSIPMSSG